MRSVAWAAVVVAVVGLSVAARPAAAQQQSGEEKEAASQPVAEAKNPFTGQPEAIQAGRKLYMKWNCYGCHGTMGGGGMGPSLIDSEWRYGGEDARSEEHTSELQSRENLVCRLLLGKKKYNKYNGGTCVMK